MTYKINKENKYEIENEKEFRIPSWTDRIL